MFAPSFNQPCILLLSFYSLVRLESSFQIQAGRFCSFNLRIPSNRSNCDHTNHFVTNTIYYTLVLITGFPRNLASPSKFIRFGFWLWLVHFKHTIQCRCCGIFITRDDKFHRPRINKSQAKHLHNNRVYRRVCFLWTESTGKAIQYYLRWQFR